MLTPLEKGMLAAMKALFENCAMPHKHWGDGDNSKKADAAIKAGRAAIAMAESQEAEQSSPHDAAIRALASDLFDDDECTVEGNARVAIADDDGAAWVECWRLIRSETLYGEGIQTEGMDIKELAEELGAC